jgi:hypothetical protein
MPQAVDPRVVALISHALDHGDYCPRTQLGLVACFTMMFGAEPWWHAMLDSDPAIAALVRLASSRVLH